MQDFQGLQAADLRAVGVTDFEDQAAILTRLRLPPPPLGTSTSVRGLTLPLCVCSRGAGIETGFPLVVVRAMLPKPG
eukprot:COSAG05_NODE_959_length_6425_cov_4.388397_4_plen_77_part_00